MSTLLPETSGPAKLRELWRTHKLSFFLTGYAVMLAGLYLTLVALPNVYEAEAVLVVHSDDPNRIILPGGKFSSEIKSTTVLSSVAEGIGKLPANAAPTTRQAVVRELRDHLKVTERGQTGAETEIRISSRGHDREKLVKLVRATTQAYIDRCRKRDKTRREEVEKRRTEWTGRSEDLQRAGGVLREAEAALARFRTENADALDQTGGDPEAGLRRVVERHTSTSAEVEKTQADVAGLEAAEKLLRTRLKDVPQFIEMKEVTSVRDPERVALEREIRMMQRQLDAMLKTYTHKPPEVISLQTNILVKKRQLRQLNQRVDQSVKSAKKQNPEYAVLIGNLDGTVVKLQLARSSLKSLSKNEATLKGRIGVLRQLADAHRKLKAELAAAEKTHLERETALQAKKKALDAATLALEPVPEINTPVTAPTKPVGPPRSLYLVGVLIGSLLAGRIAMSAAFRMSTGFGSAYELRRITGASVATTISAVPGTKADRQRRRRWRIKLGWMLVLTGVVIAAALMMLSYRPALPGTGG